MNDLKKDRKNVIGIIIVAALGYFVDVYDLILFSVVRKPSLLSLGIAGDLQIDVGVMLLNWQMAGMLIGGILWGILGDKKGRISVLFGSIFLYSAANIANGFVQDVNTYAMLRFIAGIGLAGELGAGITLVSETMPKETRGWGTTIVATVGLMGAVAAALIANEFEWRVSYFIGGAMGLVLLVLRISVYESGMYRNIKEMDVPKGSFMKLFTDRERFFKFSKCILIGLPTWFVIGVLVTFSDKFAEALGIGVPVNPAQSIMYAYIGIVIGDFVSGYMSQVMRSRKKVVMIFLMLNVVCIGIYLYFNQFGGAFFYFMCGALGFANGYWAVFVTNASEQFGTNYRATVTTAVPNIIRGTTVPLTLSFQFFREYLGIVNGALVVAVVALSIAVIAALRTEETFGKDLDYVEMT
ncbi:MAG: MFS transporter [Ignavibacteria bacterium]|nr:MFS transporter [Ignavibacteria bacterium]